MNIAVYQEQPDLRQERGVTGRTGDFCSASLRTEARYLLSRTRIEFVRSI